MSSPGAERPVVWVGAAGSGTGYGVLRTLREVWGGRVRLIAADVNPAHLVAASALADAFEQVPYVADAGFGEHVVARLQAQGVTIYAPILDEEIVWAAEAPLPPGLVTTAPSAATARRCYDKLAMAGWLEAQGIATPWTRPLAQASWYGAPLFAKPRCGRGSLGARAVGDAAALEALQATGEDLVVQARAAAPEITVDVFAGPRVRAVARERLEVKAGVCTKARLFEDAELTALAQRLASGLSLHGAFCFQVMHAPDGARWVTDVNPRPGAGTRLSVAAGVDVVAAAFAMRWGEPIEPHLGPLRARYAVRHYEEVAFEP